MRNSGEGGDSLGVAEEDELRKGETLEEMRGSPGKEELGKDERSKGSKILAPKKFFSARTARD